MIFKPYLKMLDIYYGAKCNLACNQCDSSSHVTHHTDRDPDIENIIEGINLTKEKFDIELYSLIGGEPLYYLDRIDIILGHIRKIDPTARIQFSTNGALLGKKIDEMAELLSRHDCSLFVCNHFSSFDNRMTEKIDEAVASLVEKLKLEKGDANRFLFDFMRLDNPKKDPYFAKWIDQNGAYFFGEQPKDHYYLNDKIFIHYRPQDTFKSHYHIKDGKPKPFMTGMPHKSYKDGCSSPMCSFLVDKKLYKCGALGTIKKFLTYHDALEDPDWKKYLDYKYLDLENCSEGDIIKFHVSKYCAISECDMCGTKSFDRKREDVIPIARVE